MLSNFECGRIQQAYALLKTVAGAARATHHSRNVVAKLVKQRFKVCRKTRKTSPAILKRRKALVALAKQTVKKGGRIFPKYSSAKNLSSALARSTGERRLSRRQIARDLNASGLKAFVRPRCPTRSSVDLRRKREFARKHRNIEWRKIVFSDETWLTCNEHTGKFHWTKNRADVLPLERKVRYNVPSVMVWGAVGFNYKSALVFFPAKMVKDGELKPFRLDSEKYVRRCLSSIVPALVAGKKIFQQDGARAHDCKYTKSYLARKAIAHIEDWPPYCPDLNAIERVWAILQARVGARCPLSVDELIKVSTEEWNNIPLSVINAHCAHFPSQLKKLSAPVRH